MPRNNIKLNPLASAILIGLVGSILHFLYGWLGEWPPIGIIAAVNESVWEHTKLAFIPLLIYWIRLIFQLHNNHRWTNAALGGLMSIIIAIFLIPSIYYILKYGFDLEFLYLDIINFFFSIFIAQLVGSYIFKKYSPSPIIGILSIVLILLIFVFYTYVTFNPFNFPIFISA